MPTGAAASTRCRIAERLFLSLGLSRIAQIRGALRELSPVIGGIELRLDRLALDEVTDGGWESLPRDLPRSWLASWRSPEEGGAGGARPPGILSRALAAGFRWVDVEAGVLAGGDREASTIPVERRWVSAHPPRAPRSPEDVHQAWDAVARHPAALHKLVVDADRFEVNSWVRDLDRSLEAATAGRRSLFARGWIGHPSRILGYLAGHGATFLATGEFAATAEGQPSIEQALQIYRLDRAAGTDAVYGILGRNVRPSRSPEIHNHAFRALGHPGIYIVLESDAALPVLEWIREGRLAGVSVTAPMKLEAAALVDELESDARHAGAVNMVWRKEGRLWGANTDVEAAREIFDDLDLPSGSPVAILGAGGAARAVLVALEERGYPATVYNRDPERGRRTAMSTAAAWGGPVAACRPRRFRAVVNTIPPGAELPGLAEGWHRDTALIDLLYSDPPATWVTNARVVGGIYRSGLEYLLRQAAGQVERWTGSRPPHALLAEGLRTRDASR